MTLDGHPQGDNGPVTGGAPPAFASSGQLRPAGRRRIVRRVLLAAALVAAVLVVTYSVGAYLLYDQASRTDPSESAKHFVNVTPAYLKFPVDADCYDFQRYAMTDFQDVRLASRDPGIQIAAWFVPAPDPTRAPAVVFTHGQGQSRHDPAVVVPAGMLHAHGFSVLIIDMRDHGDSTREDGRFAGGIEEQKDVLGARDWLVGQGVEPGRIGLFGVSMGAAVTLMAAANEPTIGAVWEDTGYADTQAKIVEELGHRNLPAIFAPAVPVLAKLIAGDDISSWTPLSAVRQLGGIPLFITHGGSDTRTKPENADELLAAAREAGVTADSWIAPGMGHVETYRLDPEQYEAHLVSFFERTLGRAP